jgi:monoamine oxidase
MIDPIVGIPRRRFLSGLAILGASPLLPDVVLGAEELSRQWTGDDFSAAHRWLHDPQALLREIPERQEHPELHDAIIVGGGISGLAAAYQLRDRRVVLLERESTTGGVSRSETWKGIEYALGAAYIVDPAAGGTPDPDSQEGRIYRLLQELDLLRLARKAGGETHALFTSRNVLGEKDVYSETNIRFFEHVAESDQFPSIPVEDRALLKRLDGMSFRQLLMDSSRQREIYGKAVGTLSPSAWEAIEYYFWGAFGTTSSETSAYHGLNFFAAEFTQILVFPGGNGFIARRLAERLRAQRPSTTVHTGHFVLQIERDEKAKQWIVLSHENGRIHRFRGRTVLFSAPLLLAKRMIPSLPAKQRQAIDSLQYRSYVVANVLLKRRIDRIFRGGAASDADQAKLRDSYGLTPIHGIDIHRLTGEAASSRNVFSDIVVADFADFAVKRARDRAVLTVYRPYPYPQGGGRLLSLSYAAVEKEIRAAVLEGLTPHGLRSDDIVGIRLTRWGHPMLVARPGQMLDGTLERARAPLPGLYFCHTDVQGAPAFENAMAAVDASVAAVRKHLS